MTTRRIEVEILGDASQLERAFGRAQKASSGFGKDLEKSGRGAIAATASFHGLGRAVGFASAQFLGGAGLVYGVRKAINAASDLHEQLNKTDVVFAKSSATVKKWSGDTATSLGIAQHKALEYAATFGNLLVPMGFARDKAAQMSTELVKLAADMASFNNASPEETLKALQSGLAGQVRPLREYGVFLSQARVEAEAFADGIVKADVSTRKITEAQQAYAIAATKATAATKEYGAGTTQSASANLALEKAADAVNKAVAGHVPPLDAAQKAMATYKIILKDTHDAQGDFARTSDGLANQQRILKAELDDAAATLGTELLPIVTKYTKELTAWLEKMQKSGDLQRDATKAAHLLTDALSIAAAGAKTAKEVFDAFSDVVGGDKDALKLLIGAAALWKTKGVVDLIFGFSAMTKAAGAEGAAGAVGLLRKRLLLLSTMAPIVIGVEVALHKGGIQDWLKKNVPGGAALGDSLFMYDTIWRELHGSSPPSYSGPDSMSNIPGPPPGWTPGSTAASPSVAARTSLFGGTSGASFTGRSVDGVSSTLLSRVSMAAAAVGATSIEVTSAKRAPGPGNDVKNSNHITGNAIDGYAIINGKRVPIGTAIKSIAALYGLRSGDVAGFDPKTPGGYDAIHVDDGANVNGGTPLSSSVGGGSSAALHVGKKVAAAAKIPKPPTVSNDEWAKFLLNVPSIVDQNVDSRQAALAKQHGVSAGFGTNVARAGQSVEVALGEMLSTPIHRASLSAMQEAQRGAAAIRAQLGGDKILPASTVAQLKTQLGRYEITIKDGLAGLLDAAKTKQTAFEKAFAKLSDSAFGSFDKATQEHVKQMQKDAAATAKALQVTVSGNGFLSFLYGGDVSQTPAEERLARMRKEDAQAARDKQLAADRAAGDADAVAQDLRDQEEADLEGQAALESDAAGKQLQAAQDAAQEKNDAMLDAYQEARATQRTQLQEMLTDAQTTLEQGKGDLASLAATIGDLVGGSLSDAFGTNLAIAQGNLATFLAAVAAAEKAAAGVTGNESPVGGDTLDVAQALIEAAYSATPGTVPGAAKYIPGTAAYAAAHGQTITRPLPKFASGTPGSGWAIVGERGPELAYLAAGTQIVPNDRIISATGRAVGGRRLELHLHGGTFIGSSPDAVARDLLPYLDRIVAV